MSFSGLPLEILAIIVNSLDPSTIATFRAVCRLFEQSSVQRFETHKQKLAEEAVVHDCNPITLPTLLRRIEANDPDLWYVRRFEAWVARPSWNMWLDPRNNLSYQFYSWPKRGDPIAPPEFSSDYFSTEELERYEMMLTDRLHLPEGQAGYLIDTIREGDDEPIRAMVYALLPNLQELIVVQYSLQWSAAHGPRYRPSLKTLGSIIEAADRTGQWPPGLQSLHVLEIAPPTKSRPRDDVVYLRPKEYTLLFKLPNLKSLYVGQTDILEVNTSWEPLPIPFERSSTVRQLCTSVSGLALDPIFASIKTLEHYHGDCSPVHLLEHASTLQTYNKHMYIHIFHSFHKLKQMNFFASDLLIQTTRTIRDKMFDGFDVDVLAASLPDNVCCLVVTHFVGDEYLENKAALERFQSATYKSLCNLIERRWGRVQDGIERHLCLEFTRTTRTFVQDGWRKALSSSSLTEQCQSSGVNLHFGGSVECPRSDLHNERKMKEWSTGLRTEA